MARPFFVSFLVWGLGWLIWVQADSSFAMPAPNGELGREENLGPMQTFQRTPARGRTKKLTAAFMEFKIDILDEVKVRRMNPTPAFDDKGKPKPYTAKELKNLKGPDPKLPGYNSDYDELKKGQTVKVFLGMKKEEPSNSSSTKEAKDKNQDISSSSNSKGTSTPQEGLK